MSDTALQPEERTWALLAHLSTFAGYLVPLGNILGPLVIWLARKDESAFVDRHAREALNWQISLTIYMVVAAILVFVLIGMAMVLVLALLDLILTIQAAVTANQGREYRYPITLRFV